MATRRGVTLLELLLVLVIIAMLAMLALPSMETMYGDVRVQSAADNLRGRLAQARTRAIDDNRPYRIGVKVGTGQYRLAPDSPEFWGDGNAPTDSTDDTYPAPLIVDDALPNDIVFSLDGSQRAESGGWSTLVSFLPTGACTNDCTIRLDRDDARPIEISVRALTGGISAKAVKK
jgi:prepilin-type N-terminal cleavage/methylation domain-containing protein